MCGWVLLAAVWVWVLAAVGAVAANQPLPTTKVLTRARVVTTGSHALNFEREKKRFIVPPRVYTYLDKRGMPALTSCSSIGMCQGYQVIGASCSLASEIHPPFAHYRSST